MFPPTIVNTPSTRYLVVRDVVAGMQWYPVSNDFTPVDALKLWSKPKEVQITNQDWQWSIPNSKNDGYYTVEFDKRGWSCTCPGYGFRRDCRHIKEAKTKIK